MKLNKNTDLEILRFSDSKYNKITVEIQYKGVPIAQINQDNGYLEIECFAEFSETKIPLEDLEQALFLAKQTLK